jgi:NADPH:quinone reductase-like Zn-dependent oxidoreductase
MKAVRIQKPEGFEGIEGLVYEDAPDPQPAIGDALVQVRAASFTRTELMWPLSTRSRWTRPRVADTSPRGVGHRRRARLRRRRRVGG